MQPDNNTPTPDQTSDIGVREQATAYIISRRHRECMALIVQYELNKAKMSKAELKTLLGVSHGTITNYFNAGKTISDLHLARICTALGISYAEVMIASVFMYQVGMSKKSAHFNQDWANEIVVKYMTLASLTLRNTINQTNF